MSADDKPPPKRDGIDHPNVITYPPVIFMLFYGIGYLADRAFPVELGTLQIRYAIGGLLLAFSGVLVFWALARFIRAKTHVDVRKPATSLVTDGPYRLSRNPMYVALTLFYAGFAIAFSLPLTLGALIPCLIVMRRGVIDREEAYLDLKFGDDYRAYKARVRRWI